VSDLFFEDRIDSGKRLADELKKKVSTLKPTLVLALAKGGVITGQKVAEEMKLPWDVLLVRKLGAPFNKELAVGALVEGNPPKVFLNDKMIQILKVSSEYVASETKEQTAEILRREKIYRNGKPRKNIHGESVVLIDDGIATGASVRAALVSLRAEKASKIILAVPVAPPELIEEITQNKEVDEVVCLICPKDFRAVGQFYRDFRQVTDQQVSDLMK